MPAITSEHIKVNFTPGRKGTKVDMIVLHIMEGSLPTQRPYDWFNDTKARVSAHFGVRKNGQAIEWVEPKDTAWHAGKVVRPTSTLVRSRPGINPNLYSIGIEHEGFAGDVTPGSQIKGSAELVAFLCDLFNIPCNPIHIVGHHEIRADKSCPGNLPVSKIIESASSILHRDRASQLIPPLEERVKMLETQVAAILKELRRT